MHQDQNLLCWFLLRGKTIVPNSTHIWGIKILTSGLGIKHGPHLWEVSTLTTVACYSKKTTFPSWIMGKLTISCLYDDCKLIHLGGCAISDGRRVGNWNGEFSCLCNSNNNGKQDSFSHIKINMLFHLPWTRWLKVKINFLRLILCI